MYNIYRHIANSFSGKSYLLPSLYGRGWGVGLFLFLLLFPLFSFAQTRVISGTVSDDMGPIMMANVVEKDANNRIVSASQTDMMGNFSMEVKNPKKRTRRISSKSLTSVARNIV